MNFAKLMEEIEKVETKAARYERARDRYLRLERQSGYEVGDLVKVCGKAVSEQFGWSNGWNDDMDYHDRKTYKIIAISTTGKGIKIDFKSGAFSYPFFCLELIEKGKQQEDEKEEGKKESKVDLSDFEAMFGGPAKV